MDDALRERKLQVKWSAVRGKEGGLGDVRRCSDQGLLLRGANRGQGEKQQQGRQKGAEDGFQGDLLASGCNAISIPLGQNPIKGRGSKKPPGREAERRIAVDFKDPSNILEFIKFVNDLFILFYYVNEIMEWKKKRFLKKDIFSLHKKTFIQKRMHNPLIIHSFSLLKYFFN